MNDDFIVWDKDLKIFEEIKTDSDKSFLGKYLINKNRFKIFRAIGLKDINGKNIYANCSIVEFEYRRHINSDMEKRICIFTYCKHSLKYWLRFAGDIGTFEFNPQECKNFKTIDTIQENKLGLIK